MNVQQLQHAYARKLEAIRANKDLSDEGKRRQIAREWKAHSKAMGAARQEAVADIAVRRRRLERKAFGAPPETTQADYRDALGRADALATADAAHAALSRAQRTGDAVLARAVATVAAERGWRGVLGAYAGADAVVADALDQLAGLGEQDDAAARLKRSVATSASTPPELRSLAPEQVDRLAGDSPRADDWVRTG